VVLSGVTEPLGRSFYNSTNLLEDSVRGMQAALSKALVKYNTYIPHRNLKGLTPIAYIENTLS
jgi:transposase InsO family protein